MPRDACGGAAARRITRPRSPQAAFYAWLGEVGVAGAYKNTITRLVAEKVYVLIPGAVDLTEFEG